MPWPIADEPTANEFPIVSAEGIVLGASPGKAGGPLKPNLSAIATSRAAPSRAPSGAKTELHDTANAFRSVPPHASPLAFCKV